MARSLRIERPGGCYLVTARGNEQKAIYRDRLHFLELLGEATLRFGLRVHAYVLMDNHYSWPEIVLALERSKGETWSQFSGRHGDWGRDAALWHGRRHGRYRLAELGQLAGGMDDAAVGQAVSRLGKPPGCDGLSRKSKPNYQKLSCDSRELRWLLGGAGI